ncbi:hypothetical protein KIN20_034332 [Parelaphostrongylus tenuis]|uniref:Uncharacterized protein n=1 Tax=Parelaphostrongylus tenuis TaxID=148309 RepID=A0AAD5R9W7_PARTN|nr:hypothetical protein KIN20_034332 [Parelaphostrongylus tenuis]
MRELVMYLQRDMVPDSAVVPSFRSSPFSSRYTVQSPVGIDVSDQEETGQNQSCKQNLQHRLHPNRVAGH